MWIHTTTSVDACHFSWLSRIMPICIMPGMTLQALMVKSMLLNRIRVREEYETSGMFVVGVSRWVAYVMMSR